MTGLEAAEKEADRAKAIEKAKKQAQLHHTAEEVVRAAEALINAELIAEIKVAAESTSDSEASEVAEEVFATPISPPRGTMLALVRSVTPEVSRKRSFTLVQRTPDKRRAPPVVLTTPCCSTASEAPDLYPTPSEPTEIPSSTAPARLDGRIRREGKNPEYIRAMEIERGGVKEVERHNSESPARM